MVSVHVEFRDDWFVRLIIRQITPQHFKGMEVRTLTWKFCILYCILQLSYTYVLDHNHVSWPHFLCLFWTQQTLWHSAAQFLATTWNSSVPRCLPAFQPWGSTAACPHYSLSITLHGKDEDLVLVFTGWFPSNLTLCSYQKVKLCSWNTAPVVQRIIHVVFSKLEIKSVFFWRAC